MAVERRTGDRVARARVEAALDEAAAQAAREAARKTAARAAGGYFLLLLFLFIGAGFYQNHTNHSIHVTNARLERSEIRACERLQVQRERANVSDARQYLLSAAIAQAPRASMEIRSEYAGLARTANYDPPTDCVAAVRDPGGYERPASVPYCAPRPGVACRGGVFPREFARAVVQAARDGKPQPQPRG